MYVLGDDIMLMFSADSVEDESPPPEDSDEDLDILVSTVRLLVVG